MSLNKQMMLESRFEAAYARGVIRSSFVAPPSAWTKVGGQLERLIEMRYLDAPTPLAPYRELLVRSGMLEAVREKVLFPFVLPKKISMEAKSCGEPNAYWDPERQL
jgi:hypothetical protein